MRISKIAAVFLLSMILTTGCSSSAPAQESGNTSSTPASVQQPDDLVITPGGYVYRANFHQQGEPDRWPEIVTSQVNLADNVTVIYRASITTAQGQTRNNLVSVRQAGVRNYLPLKLIVSNVSAGLKVTEGQNGGGLPGTSVQALVIQISKDVKPGEYSFSIDVSFGGKDYGTIPCTVTVTKD